MVKSMYVVKQKSKSGTEYLALEIDFGYRKEMVLTMDKLLLPELCGMTPQALYSMKVGDREPVFVSK